MAHEILNRGVGFLTQRHCDKNTTHSEFLLAQIVLLRLVLRTPLHCKTPERGWKRQKREGETEKRETVGIFTLATQLCPLQTRQKSDKQQ